MKVREVQEVHRAATEDLATEVQAVAVRMADLAEEEAVAVAEEVLLAAEADDNN